MEWMKKFQRESEMWLMFTEYWKPEATEIISLIFLSPDSAH